MGHPQSKAYNLVRNSETFACFDEAFLLEQTPSEQLRWLPKRGRFTIQVG